MNNILVSSYPTVISSIKFNLSLKLFWILISAVILSLLVISIIQINAYTQEIYLIRDQETRLNQLTQENKFLEIDYSNSYSLNNIGNYAQNQTFEKTNNTEYIRVLESTALAK